MTMPAELDRERLPRHVAVIMDGNGRWAQSRGLPHSAGHEAGAESVRVLVEACRELGCIEFLTLYTFSTENWRRSYDEINSLFDLLSRYIRKELDNVHEKDIRIVTMGRVDAIPRQALEDLNHAVQYTAANRSMTLNLALNYGARTEIVDAVQAICRKVRKGELEPDAIDETVIQQHLYHPDFPDPDLLIRTSGELRLSNFMLWQLSYAEIVVTDVLWPDFRKEHFYAALLEYQSRERRFGGR